MSVLPDSINLCRTRGDTFAMQFTVKDDATPAVVVDVTGATFLLTVDPEPDPTDALNNLFQLTGTLVDAPNGLISFAPNVSQADQSPDTYFYDIQMTDSAGAIRTIAKGKWTVPPDITK